MNKRVKHIVRSQMSITNVKVERVHWDGLEFYRYSDLCWYEWKDEVLSRFEDCVLMEQRYKEYKDETK